MPRARASCDACGKSYANVYNLQGHLERQPLCKRWMDMRPGLRDYVDAAFRLPQTDAEIKSDASRCGICSKVFANTGNLNRHLLSSTTCRKWAMYQDLKPLVSAVEESSVPRDAAPFEGAGSACSLTHIIWNVFLTDKDVVSSPDFADILRRNNIQYVVAILPEGKSLDFPELNGVRHGIMAYRGHNVHLDRDAFDEQCGRIEEHRRRRENVLVFCNNGYQRSLPFLCYYLRTTHPEEVPSVERAIDIVLSPVFQLHNENFAGLRDAYTYAVGTLLEAVGV